MQYIQNIVFWLTAAMDAATTAITLGIIALLVCLFGIGLGVGRLWNAKWKLNASALGISVIMGLLAAVLMMVYTAMGYVQENIMSPTARKVVKEHLKTDLINNENLMNEAFQTGLTILKTTGEDTESIGENTVDFTIPGKSEEAIEANTKKFIDGVIKAISGTSSSSQKNKGKKKIETLNDMPPFSYGFPPVNRDADGTIGSALNDALDESNSNKISCEDPKPIWYITITKSVVDNSIQALEKNVCDKLDSQRTSVVVLMIVLMLLQTGIISWLAYSDIRPRRI